MAIGDLDVRLSTYNYFSDAEALITASPARPGSIYEPGDRGGSPRASLLSSAAPFVQALWTDDPGVSDSFSVDTGIIWDHNQVNLPDVGTPGAARLIYDDRDIMAITRLSPTAVAARTNLTTGAGGLAGYQADPADTRDAIAFSGDVPTSQASNTEARLTFAVADEVDRPLSGNSTVFVRYTLATPGTFPTLVVELWVGGSLAHTIYNATAMGTATEVVQGVFPSTDVPGTSFEIRAKSTTTGSSVAAASACMVVAERSGWEGDSGWIDFATMDREQRTSRDPRKVLYRGFAAGAGGNFKYLCARFRDASFPVFVGEVWFGLGKAPQSASVGGNVSLGDGTSVSRRSDGSAQQTPAGGFIAAPGAWWPISLSLGWKLVDTGSAVDLLLSRVGGRGPNSRIAVVSTSTAWDVVTGIYAATSSVSLEPNRSAEAVRADGLSLVMSR